MASPQPRTKVYIIAHRIAAQEMISSELSSEPLELIPLTDKQQYFDILDDIATCCTLVDVSKNPEEELKTIAAIRARQQRMHVIAFSDEWKISTAVRAIQLGAKEVCQVPAGGNGLIRAIGDAIAIASARPPEKLPTVPVSVLEKLNLEEVSFLRLIILCLTAKEASAFLDVSVRTFHYRKHAILRRLGAVNRCDLIEFISIA